MSVTVEELAAEVGLPGFVVAELEPVVAALRSLIPTYVPQPSPALAALLAHPPRFVARTPRRHRYAVGAAAAALTSLTATGVAAAAGELPPSAQDLVAHISEKLLPGPLQLPESDAGRLNGSHTSTGNGGSDGGGSGDAPLATPSRDDATSESTAVDPTPTVTTSAQPRKVPSNGATAQPSAPPSSQPGQTSTPAPTATATASVAPSGSADPSASPSATDGTESDGRIGVSPGPSPSESPTGGPAPSTGTGAGGQESTATAPASPPAGASDDPSAPTYDPDVRTTGG